MTVDLVGRGVRALSEHLNRYYRVWRGIDQDSFVLRLNAGGAFQVRHSVTNGILFNVTDAGASGVAASGPKALVGRSAVWPILHNTATLIEWDTETYDTDAMHDLVVFNNRLTAKTAGLYLINAYVWWDIGTVGWRYATIRHQAAPVSSSRLPPVAGSYTEQQVAAQVQLAVGEYVEVAVQQTQNATLNVLVGSRFSAVRVMA